jgi:hypothetical protein
MWIDAKGKKDWFMVFHKILGMIFKTEIVKSIYYRHSCIPTCSNNIQQPGAHPYIFFLLTCISRFCLLYEIPVLQIVKWTVYFMFKVSF